MAQKRLSNSAQIEGHPHKIAQRPIPPSLPKKLISAMRRNRLKDGRRISSAPLTLGRIGSLEIRLAQTEREVKKAQRLRYKVFYKEMGAKPSNQTKLTRRDADAFDAICDHLLVLDHACPKKKFRKNEPRIVGTYRLLRQDRADMFGGFYSANEFNIQPMLERHPDARFLELGRSCVLKDYRTKRTIELLWQGIWAYVQIHRIDVMFGCASLAGTDPKELAEPLTFLSKQGDVPKEWNVEAWPDIAVPLQQMKPQELNDRKALRQLPPLVKAYMRIGCYFGSSAMVDHQFGTTDVFIIMPIDRIDRKYIEHYSTDHVKSAVEQRG
ncbi:GNAT family N-acetyltransferase [Cohaesibacter gelatinilyticus]|uniref:L-ornithine N(alpha)-acyltransferase n=1 Tax=Cohaesibacter gelatinilyticus TaxID=372072 RepID=A0A285PE06_9HYPH|nr:GNAT family N-acyltransferase [Cohaesibacter gelatinilyticus]SNZ19959.1 ornithine-acyl[acyl carrier protein] N-acyltransferase [Cohaesibacter gelatinilyticus]HAT87593.1 GNAT family N-acetyltransferase [Hyphomicrobiales bacterium]